MTSRKISAIGGRQSKSSFYILVLQTPKIINILPRNYSGCVELYYIMLGRAVYGRDACGFQVFVEKDGCGVDIVCFI